MCKWTQRSRNVTDMYSSNLWITHHIFYACLVKERSNTGPGQKLLSAKRLPSTDHTELRGSHKPGPRRTASERYAFGPFDFVSCVSHFDWSDSTTWHSTSYKPLFSFTLHCIFVIVKSSLLLSYIPTEPYNCHYHYVRFYTFTVQIGVKALIFFLCRPHQLCVSMRGITREAWGQGLSLPIDWVGQLGL